MTRQSTDPYNRDKGSPCPPVDGPPGAAGAGRPDRDGVQPPKDDTQPTGDDAGPLEHDARLAGDDPRPPGDDARPPADGAAVRLAVGVPAATDLYELAYCDERFRFGDGSWGRFGRDDLNCEIPIWTEIRDVSLSRVAGEIWCADGQLWVRNLSGSHELVVRGQGGRPQWLARREPGTRGAACSIPAEGARLMAPSTGDWFLWATRIAQAGPGDRPATSGRHPESTVRVSAVPDRFAAVAAALCAPLLADGDAAATYDEIARTLGISRRQARRQVEQLCDHYRAVLPVKVLPPAAAGTPSYQPLAGLLVARGLVAR